MEPRLSSIKWCLIKAGGGKENTKRNAYHEGDGYAFRKNQFIDKKIGGMTLINKMVSNQSWGEERKTQKGMQTLKETYMLTTKIDLLMKRLQERAQDKDAMMGTV